MRRIGIAILLALAALVPLGRAEAAWPDDGSYTAWSHCFKITSQASKIDGVNDWYWLDLADMPPAFHAAAQVDLDDFRATSDGETAINHRLIYYNSGTDTGLVAIAQPHGSGGASSDVDSYVYIGNAGASSTSTASTFPATLEGLWMLQEQPTSSTAILDYTSNARNSTAISGSMTSGDLVTSGPHSGLGAVAFDVDDRATFASTLFDDCETANAFTWMAWLHLDSNPAGGLGFFGSAGSQVQIGRDGVTEDPIAVVRNSANSGSFTSTGGGGDDFPISTWLHYAVVYNGATLKTYINGVEISSASATSLRSASLNFYIGHNNSVYSRSTMAEHSVSSVAFSVDQINSMRLSATDSAFWIISEVTAGGGTSSGSFFFGG